MAFKAFATSGDQTKKYLWLASNYGQSIRIWIYVTTDTAATVAASGYITEQQFLDAMKTGDLIFVIQVGSISDAREIIDDIGTGGLTNLTLHTVTENTGSVIDLSDDFLDGQDGVTGGLNYTFDSTITMADPGAGDVRFNNATLASVTALAVDDTSADTGNPDFSAYIVTWDDSTSTNKGTLIVRKADAQENFAIFTVTSLTDNSGWTQLAVTYVTSSGSFSDGDDITLTFLRTGDAGSGDVATTGAPVTSGNIVEYADTTGQVVQDSGNSVSDFALTSHTHTMWDITDAGALATLNTVSATEIDNNSISYAKIQDITATQRLIGRNTAGAGDPEEVTLTQALDWAGTAAQGDILYRGASAWALLAAGTSGQVLQTQGAGANPQWASGGGFTRGTATNTTSGTAHDYTSIPSGTNMIVIMLSDVSTGGSGELMIQIGDSGGIETSGYNGGVFNQGGKEQSGSGFQITRNHASTVEWNGTVTLTHLGSNIWTCSGALSTDATDNEGVAFSGSKTLSAELDRIRLTNLGSPDTFDNGVFNIMYN